MVYYTALSSVFPEEISTRCEKVAPSVIYPISHLPLFPLYKMWNITPKDLAERNCILYNGKRGGMDMKVTLLCVFLGVCTALGTATLVFCLAYGKEPERKKLRLSAFLACVILALRFGGGAVLARLDMGWRCTPRYTLDFILLLLLLISVYYAIQTFGTPGSKKTPRFPVWICGFSSLIAAILIIPALMLALSIGRLSEEVVTRDGQTMVREYRINGGAVSYCYAPINSLVHGKSLDYDWWGT